MNIREVPCVPTPSLPLTGSAPAAAEERARADDGRHGEADLCKDERDPEECGTPVGDNTFGKASGDLPALPAGRIFVEPGAIDALSAGVEATQLFDRRRGNSTPASAGAIRPSMTGDLQAVTRSALRRSAVRAIRSLTAMAVAAVVASSPATADQLHTEIIHNVVDKCFAELIDTGYGTPEALHLAAVKRRKSDTMEQIVEDLRPIVKGKSPQSRREIYTYARHLCRGELEE